MTAVQRHPNERVMSEVPADITPGSRAGSRSGGALASGSGSEHVGWHKGTGAAAILQHLLQEEGKARHSGHSEDTAPHQHARPKKIPPP